MMHFFTKDNLDYLRQIAPGQSAQEITQRFNEHFNLEVTINQIRWCKKNHKISSGFDGHFAKGHKPINAIQKGQHIGISTEFKKGGIGWNRLPVGSERVKSDGYIGVKIEEPNKWKAKHVILWENFYGPVQKGYKLVFLDGNKQNVSLENLVQVTYAEMLLINQHGLINTDPELSKTGVLLATLMNRTFTVKKKKGGKK